MFGKLPSREFFSFPSIFLHSMMYDTMQLTSRESQVERGSRNSCPDCGEEHICPRIPLSEIRPSIQTPRRREQRHGSVARNGRREQPPAYDALYPYRDRRDSSVGAATRTSGSYSSYRHPRCLWNRICTRYSHILVCPMRIGIYSSFTS